MGREEIRRFQVFGERNTGTNYMASLMLGNFPELEYVTGRRQFGWKHGDLGQPWKWFNGAGELLASDPLPTSAAGDALLIVMWREVYVWLQSMQRKPHHAPALLDLDFSSFIRRPWCSYYGAAGDDFSAETLVRRRMMERPGARFESFANVLELRRYKMRLHIAFAQRVPNIAFINLETLQAYPEATLRLLAGYFDLKLSPSFVNVAHAKHTLARYRPRPLRPMSVRDVMFIARNVDWRAEAVAGYAFPDWARATLQLLSVPYLQRSARRKRSNSGRTLVFVRDGQAACTSIRGYAGRDGSADVDYGKLLPGI